MDINKFETEIRKRAKIHVSQCLPFMQPCRLGILSGYSSSGKFCGIIETIMSYEFIAAMIGKYYFF